MDGTRQAPIGELLVQHGGMSEDHLRAALDEQRTTGRPLGEIVVARGYVPAAMVAQALATQHGGLTKTEYGYATGWAQAVDERDRALAELRRWAESAQAAISARDAEIARLEGQLASIDNQETARLREVLADQAQSVAAANALVDETRARVHVLEAELAAAAAFEAEAAAASMRAADAAERVQALEAELAAGASEDAESLAAANARADEAQARVAVLEAQLAAAAGFDGKAKAASARAEELEAELGDMERQLERASTLIQELQAAAAATRDPWAGSGSHLLFVRRPGGYEVVERDGPPPPAGATLDVGTVQRVSALGGKPCAYVID